MSYLTKCNWWTIWLSVMCELFEDMWFKDMLYKDVLFEDVWFKDVLYKDVIIDDDAI